MGAFPWLIPMVEDQQLAIPGCSSGPRRKPYTGPGEDAWGPGGSCGEPQLYSAGFGQDREEAEVGHQVSGGGEAGNLADFG